MKQYRNAVLPPLNEADNYLQIVDISFGVQDSPTTERLSEISSIRDEIELEKKRLSKRQ